jgi:hypothetical protein
VREPFRATCLARRSLPDSGRWQLPLVRDLFQDVDRPIEGAAFLDEACEPT